jgi:uncharacterized protein (DUF2225 family)/CRP-like cAMP-binding protein
MADLNLLCSLGTVKQFAGDEVVFMEDDVGENMYIVLKGLFGVYVNSFVDFPVRVAGVEQGSFFGEMSVIDGWPRSATIVSEKDGAALVIEKDHFELLLNKSPDIANSILSTLHTRADSTARAVRDTGIYVPPTPQLPDTWPDDADVKCKLALMTTLAQHIRQTNTLLYEKPVAKKGTLKLLPEGYTLFNVKDENDNTPFLQKKNVTCPFCDNKSEAFVPHLSKLEQLRTDMDGRVVYKDFNILLYTNIVCPNCNFTDTYREFVKFRQNAGHPKYRSNRFKNTENFTGFADTHSRTVDEAILSYYLNIRCLERAFTDPLRLAKAWIRLYWIYNDLKETDYARKSADKTIEMYEKYTYRNAGGMSEYDQMRVNAVMGEISAGVGEYRQAKRYFEENIRLGRNAPPVARELLELSLERFREVSEPGGDIAAGGAVHLS